MLDSVVVVVGDERRLQCHNNRFAEMGNIPFEVILTGDDEVLLNCALVQLKNPKEFIEKISSLMACSSSWKDVIEFLDGHIFNCRSAAVQDLLAGQYRVLVFHGYQPTASREFGSSDGLIKSTRLGRARG